LADVLAGHLAKYDQSLSAIAGQERVNKADLLSAIIAHGEFV
jgi:hypothetical protein